MGAPGFWDDSERAAGGLGRARARHAAAGVLRRAARRRRGPRGAGRDGRRGRPRCRPRSRGRSPRSRSASRRSRSSACSPAPTTPATRSSRSTPARAAPTRRTGRRWCCAWRCAGPSGAASRSSCSRLSPGEEAGIKSATFRVSGRERLRPVRRREGRAPARAPVAVRLRPPPPDELRGRRGGAGGRGRRRGRDRRRRPPGRHLPRLRRRRPARQQDRLRGAHHAPPDGHRRAVPERALAVLQPGDGDGDAARQAARARGARTPGGDRAREGRGAGRQLRLADPLLRAAPLHDGQGPRAPATRWATCSACSTATSTRSCARTCCARRRGTASREHPGPRDRRRRAGRARALALQEDLGDGDVTTEATVPPTRARPRARSCRRRPA